MRTLYKCFHLLWVILLLNQVSIGQGWIRNFPNATLPGYHHGMDVVQAPNGDFISCGSLGNGVYFVRTDADGDTIWTKEYTSVNTGYNATSLQLLADGSIAAVSRNSASGIVLKLDASGNLIYANNWGWSGGTYPNSIRSTTDGGFVIGGTTSSFGGGALSNQLFIAKTDALGDTTWVHHFGDALFDTGNEVRQTADGGYVAVGTAGTFTSAAKEMYVIKLDATGTLVWEKKHTIGNQKWAGYSIQQTLDGGYIATGNNYDTTAANVQNMLVVKMNSGGNVEWVSNPLASDLDCAGLDVIQNPDSSYMIVGYIGSFVSTQGGFPEYRLPLVKVDKNGMKLWEKFYLRDSYTIPRIKGESIKRTLDGGYIIGGTNFIESVYSEKMLLLKVDSLGNAVTTAIQGTVYADLNDDCNWDSLEYPLSNWVVVARGNNGLTYYANTDTSGNYSIEADFGTYEVTLAVPNVYWDTVCIGLGTVVLDTVFDVDTVDFPVRAFVPCPLLNVDISSLFLRLCFPSYYYVNYCNWGMTAAQNAYVDVELDSFMTYDTSSIASTHLGGNVYRFNLGTVPQGACGRFYIDVNIACDTNLAGRTHCSQAHIYPDTVCLNPWTGPNINLDANCLGDTAMFRIQNTGGNMSSALAYNIFEDNVMMLIGNYNLGTGQVETVYIPTQNGKTYRMEARQVPAFPPLLGDTLLGLALEGCTMDSLGNISTGFVTQFSNYDGSPFIDIDCQPNIGSYDPNDKLAYPTGYGAEHYIYEHTDLEYYVRFQNTGTDTAFKVVIIDTISSHLDITSLEARASSHAYTYEIYGTGIVKFTFDNILLPDSTTNNAGSRGFIKYKIEQKAGNPVGTIINNNADIYFDYNAPIRTNTTFHEIGDNFVTIQLLGVEDVLLPNTAVKVYPNPFHERATVSIDGGDFNKIEFELYDMTGRNLYRKVTTDNQFDIHQANLPQGVYVYRIVADGALLNTGKLMVK